jgi:hypothetical protein
VHLSIQKIFRGITPGPPLKGRGKEGWEGVEGKRKGGNEREWKGREGEKEGKRSKGRERNYGPLTITVHLRHRVHQDRRYGQN